MHIKIWETLIYNSFFSLPPPTTLTPSLQKYYIFPPIHFSYHCPYLSHCLLSRTSQRLLSWSHSSSPLVLTQNFRRDILKSVRLWERSYGWQARSVHNIKLTVFMLQTKICGYSQNCHMGKHAKEKPQKIENHSSRVALFQSFSMLTSIFFPKYKTAHVISFSKIFKWLPNISYTSNLYPSIHAFPFFLLLLAKIF